MAFLVVKVIDGDTFEVTPKWDWKNEQGNRVRIRNYNAPELGSLPGLLATNRLSSIILNKYVELRNPVTFSFGRLVCDAIIEGIDITVMLN